MREKISAHALLFLTWIYTYFQPTLVFIGFIGFIIVVDTFTGILAAEKKGTLNNKVSKKMRPAIEKFIMYGIAVIISFVIERVFLGGEIPAVKLVSGYILSIELKSIDENYKVITNFSLFQSILTKIKLK